MTTAYVNRIATAVPAHQVHDAFQGFASRSLPGDRRRSALLRRMMERGGIEQRFSVLAPASAPATASVDAEGFYTSGAFPSTAVRMRRFEQEAPALAERAVEGLGLGRERDGITHVVVTCCTGFSAPGLDIDIIHRCRINPSAERTLIGFMGCYAAVTALKFARHVVRSDPAARVLVVNLEICTLHLQETEDLEKLLSFYLFADGCAAALVSAEPLGLALDSFQALLAPGTSGLITWNIRDSGFDMILSGQVPAAIHAALAEQRGAVLDGQDVSDITLWAIHPGGRTVLDAVEQALDLHPQALGASRSVLRDFGNMSSATVMFVLARMLERASPGDRGCAMAFGPGLVAETMLFHAVE